MCFLERALNNNTDGKGYFVGDKVMYTVVAYVQVCIEISFIV